MSENRGIFSLEEFYDLQVSGETTNIFEVFRYLAPATVPAGTDYGYWFGADPQSSAVDRLDFSNDTTNLTSTTNATYPAAAVAGTSSIEHGYFNGGYSPGPTYTTIGNRLDYANDTSTLTVKGNLTIQRRYHMAVGNSSAGYVVGGYDGDYSSRSSIDKIDYSNDTTATNPGAKITLFSSGSAGAGNQSYGYYAGGFGISPSSQRSNVERIDYSSDTSNTSPKGELTAAKYYMAGASNSDYGWYTGGSPGGGRSSVDRIDYSNDTASASPKGNLSVKRFAHGATGNSSYGYFGGNNSPANRTTTDRIDYSNDTATASPKGLLTINRQAAAAVSSRENANPLTITSLVQATRTETGSPQGTDYGYWFGGSRPVHDTNRSYIQRLDFSNDTAVMTVSSYMTNPSPVYGRGTPFSVASTSYAYASENELGPSLTKSSTIQRLDLANDSVNAPPVSTMPTASINWFAVGNTSYGWIAGGQESPGNGGMSTVNRLDYSNDTATAAPRGTLTFEASSSYSSGASTGNLNYGWFTQGNFDSGSTSYIDRVDYSNDTGTASPRGNLSSPAGGGSATGNLDYGWFATNPGNANRTDIDRVDYSNDTPTASPKGKLSSNSKSRGATGNQSYGYFAGGGGPAPEYTRTSNERVDYSNDTATSSPKGPLYAGAAYISAASSRANGLPNVGSKTVDKGADGFKVAGPLGPAYGYFGGSFSPGQSSLKRIEFANDTATTAVKGSLTAVKGYARGMSSPAYGYLAGGYGPSTPSPGITTIDRIDYSSDTDAATPKGNLVETTRNGGATGTSSYGYIGGGPGGGSATSRIERIDFSNDTATAEAKGNLYTARDGLNATGNASYGYWGGGHTGWPNFVSIVDRVDYSNDTATASPKGPLSQHREGLAATGNASYGYWGGGYGPSSNHSIVDRLDYSSDTTTAAVKGPLSVARRRLGGATGNSSYGYWGGGETPSSISTIDRVDYSNDTPTASPKGPLSSVGQQFGTVSSRADGMQGSPTFIPRVRWVDSASPTPAVTAGPSMGYFTAGFNNHEGSSRRSRIQRIDFSNDTATAVQTSYLSSPRMYSAGASNSSYGYAGGGNNNSVPTISTIDRIDYSADTAATAPKGPLSTARNQHSAMGNASYGYYMGSDPVSSGVDRLDFSNDTAATAPKGPLSHTNRQAAGTGNQSYGYNGGGIRPGVSTVIDRIDYSNDTATASPKGNLNDELKQTTATGNTSFGYWGGGKSPGGVRSLICRLDYSNDSANTLSKGPLSAVRYFGAATGDASFGYFTGIDWPAVPSTIERLDFSNDTTTASPKGNLETALYAMGTVSAKENGLPSTNTAAIAAPVQPPFPYPVQSHNPVVNKGYGYHGGGFAAPNPPASGRTSATQRIEYANDTSTASPKGVLSSSRYTLGATSSIDFGYWGGGNTNASQPNGVSTIDRLDYANDSTATVPRGPLSRIMHKFTAVGNASYGYYCGGYDYQYSNSTLVQRLDFADDTETATPKGPLSANQQGWSAGAGNQSYGYIAGGDPSRSRVDRIDYSNDTATATQKGPLEADRNRMGATGNASYGYFAGGSPSTSLINRIDYGNDTATTSPKGNLTNAGYLLGATGNTSYGYISGGYYPGTPDDGQTNVLRIEFANDTATTSPKGNLDSKSYGGAATSAAENAMP